MEQIKIGQELIRTTDEIVILVNLLLAKRKSIKTAYQKIIDTSKNIVEIPVVQNHWCR